MANIKSQKKRALTNRKRQLANLGQKTEVKSSIKKVLTAVEAKDAEAAAKACQEATKVLDKAAAGHIVNDNYASRQKSRLAKAVNSIEK